MRRFKTNDEKLNYLVEEVHDIRIQVNHLQSSVDRLERLMLDNYHNRQNEINDTNINDVETNEESYEFCAFN